MPSGGYRGVNNARCWLTGQGTGDEHPPSILGQSLLAMGIIYSAFLDWVNHHVSFEFVARPISLWSRQLYVAERVLSEPGSSDPARLRVRHAISARLWAVLPSRQVAMLRRRQETHQLLNLRRIHCCLRNCVHGLSYVEFCVSIREVRGVWTPHKFGQGVFRGSMPKSYRLPCQNRSCICIVLWI